MTVTGYKEQNCLTCENMIIFLIKSCNSNLCDV